MKYAFIQRQHSRWPVSVMCEVLGLSPGGYHQHFTRQVQCGERSRLSDDALLVHIKAIHAESKGSYGWPRVWKELLARGIRVGKDRVRRLMQQHGIKARGKRRFKATTNSSHHLPVAPNLLERRFNVAAPDQVWAGDITYIATDEGWLYLAVVIDLFSRQVVGWSLGERMTRQLVMDALRMAWFRRCPDKRSGLIFHSNRGSQGGFNRSSQHRVNGRILSSHSVLLPASSSPTFYAACCSMSAPQLEAPPRSIEISQYPLGSIGAAAHWCSRSCRAAKDEVIDWLLWYNSRRLHSTLGYISPMQYEQRWLAAQPKTVNM